MQKLIDYIFTKTLALITLLSIILIIHANAQNLSPDIIKDNNGTNKIYGQVIDASGKAVELASVYLVTWGSNSSSIGTLTKEDGSFVLENINPGQYQLIASFIGYKSFKSSEIIINNNIVNLGKILLVDANQKLQDVVVTDQKKLIEIKTDRIVYNAEKDVTNAGGSATDVLKKVPMVNVDAEGNVDLRGNTDILVLINGKPSPIFTNNLSDALELLPADQIKKIEVITTPSAKYGSEGSKGIINIITTEEKKYMGVNGNINLAAGTRSRASGSINYYNKKFSASLMLGGYGSLKTKGSYSFKKEIFNPINDNKYINTYGTTWSHRLGLMPYLTLNYDFDEKNTLSSSLMFASRKNYNDQNVNQEILNINTNPLYQDYNKSNKVNISNGADWTISYAKKFDKKDQELNVDYELSNNKANSDLNTNTFSSETNDNIINKSLSYNPSRNLVNSLQLFYSHPINNNIKLELGTKTKFKTITTKYNYELYKNEDTDYFTNNIVGDNIYIYNIINKINSSLDFNQNIYAGYIMFNYNIDTKTSLILGSRIEHTYNKAEFINNDSTSNINTTYNNLMPSLAFIYKLTEVSSFKINYRRGIYRPTVRYLNPYEDRSDSLNIKKGNPNLLPENNDLFEVGYNIFFRNIPIANIIAFYERTTNAIEPIAKNLDNGSSLTTYENIGTQNKLGLSLLSSYRLFNNLNLSGEISLFTSSYSNINEQNINASKYISYKARLYASYSIINNLNAETFIIFNSPKYTAQGKRPSFSMLSLGLRKIFTKNLSTSLSLANPFKQNIDFITENKTDDFYQTSISSIPFRFIVLGLRYKFGKVSDAKSNKNRSKDIFNDNKETSNTETNF